MKTKLSGSVEITTATYRDDYSENVISHIIPTYAITRYFFTVHFKLSPLCLHSCHVSSTAMLFAFPVCSVLKHTNLFVPVLLTIRYYVN